MPSSTCGIKGGRCSLDSKTGPAYISHISEGDDLCPRSGSNSKCFHFCFNFTCFEHEQISSKLLDQTILTFLTQKPDSWSEKSGRFCSPEYV